MSIHTAEGLEQKELELTSIPQTTEQTLDRMFPEQEREEKDLKLAKNALGLLAFELTPEELKATILEVEFLTETWLDDFERSIFKGLTLRELLHEKGAR